jgi:hypothetical protein
MRGACEFSFKNCLLKDSRGPPSGKLNLRRGKPDERLTTSSPVLQLIEYRHKAFEQNDLAPYLGFGARSSGVDLAQSEAGARRAGLRRARSGVALVSSEPALASFERTQEHDAIDASPAANARNAPPLANPLFKIYRLACSRTHSRPAVKNGAMGHASFAKCMAL